MQYCQKYKTNLVEDVMKAVYATAGKRNDATLALIAMKNCDGREKLIQNKLLEKDLHEQTVFQHLLIYL